MRSCSRSLAGVCATVRVGLAGAVAEDGEAVSNRPILPQAEIVNAAHSKTGAAKRRRPVIFSRRPARSVTSAHTPGSCFDAFSSREPVSTSLKNALVPAEHFNLPHPEHLDSWPTPRLDKAADTNPSIFEGLRQESGGLERRHHAP